MQGTPSPVLPRHPFPFPSTSRDGYREFTTLQTSSTSLADTTPESLLVNAGNVGRPWTLSSTRQCEVDTSSVREVHRDEGLSSITQPITPSIKVRKAHYLSLDLALRLGERVSVHLIRPSAIHIICDTLSVYQLGDIGTLDVSSGLGGRHASRPSGAPTCIYLSPRKSPPRPTDQAWADHHFPVNR